jgi:hypothetical protein
MFAYHASQGLLRSLTQDGLSRPTETDLLSFVRTDAASIRKFGKVILTMLNEKSISEVIWLIQTQSYIKIEICTPLTSGLPHRVSAEAGMQINWFECPSHLGNRHQFFVSVCFDLESISESQHKNVHRYNLQLPMNQCQRWLFYQESVIR